MRINGAIQRELVVFDDGTGNDSKSGFVNLNLLAGDEVRWVVESPLRGLLGGEGYNVFSIKQLSISNADFVPSSGGKFTSNVDFEGKSLSESWSYGSFAVTVLTGVWQKLNLDQDLADDTFHVNGLSQTVLQRSIPGGRTLLNIHLTKSGGSGNIAVLEIVRIISLDGGATFFQDSNSLDKFPITNDSDLSRPVAVTSGSGLPAGAIVEIYVRNSGTGGLVIEPSPTVNGPPVTGFPGGVPVQVPAVKIIVD